MHRATVLPFAFAVLAACHGTPPQPKLTPLAVTTPIAVHYEGSVGALTPADDAALAAPSPDTAAPGTPAVAFRATLLELPRDEARALVPDLGCAAPPPVEVLADGSMRAWSERGVTDSDGPMFTTRRQRAIGLGGGRVERTALRSALTTLASHGRVAMAPMASAAFDTSATLTVQKQRAFVRGMRLAAIADSVLVDDIDVATFDEGARFRFTAHRHGSDVAVDVEWLDVRAVLPVPYGGGIQLPVLERHHVTARAVLRENDGLVLGSLPGRDGDSVLLLCVEIDPLGTSVARHENGR